MNSLTYYFDNLENDLCASKHIRLKFEVVQFFFFASSTIHQVKLRPHTVGLKIGGTYKKFRIGRSENVSGVFYSFNLHISIRVSYTSKIESSFIHSLQVDSVSVWISLSLLQPASIIKTFFFSFHFHFNPRRDPSCSPP